MTYADLSVLCEDVNAAEAMLFEIATVRDTPREMTIRDKLSRGWFEVRSSIFETLSARLREAMRYARYIDREIGEALLAILGNNEFEKKLTSFVVAMNIERERTVNARKIYHTIGPEHPRFLWPLIKLLAAMPPRKSSFNDKDFPINELLVSLRQISNNLTFLKEKALQIPSLDEELFKPGSINNEVVAGFIESAIECIEGLGTISDNDKENIIKQLRSVSSELGSKSPSWKKIIGALVVTAAIISGLADAKQAYDNISSAIQHIIGYSIEKHVVPHPMLSPPRELDTDFEEGEIAEV